MELEFTDDQIELQTNVRQVLDGACPTSLVRAVYEDAAPVDDLWRQMVDLYWPGVAVPEAAGGLGLSFVELVVVAEELGRVAAPGPYLATATQYIPTVLEAAHPDQAAELLAAVLEQGATGTLALAERGRPDLAATTTVARPTDAGWVIDGTKTDVVDGATADEIAVVARAEGSSGTDGLGVFVVPGTDVKATPRTTLDPTLPLADVVFDHVVVGADRALTAPGTPGAAEAATRALQQATVALAAATVGSSRRIFDLTLEYAKEREQYGRPIGSFQALKHRFADATLAVERATALCYYAALTIAEDDDRRAEATALAKAAAGDCQQLLVGEGLQLHGGIGYTWEHDLHFFLKRAKAGDALLGNATYHRARLARLLGLTQAAEVAS